MVELPSSEPDEGCVVTEGYFEREVLLSADETAAVLRDLADQLEAGNELTVSSDEWEIPFQFREPVEVEIEFIGDGSRELEIELEFEWDNDGSLSVE